MWLLQVQRWPQATGGPLVHSSVVPNYAEYFERVGYQPTWLIGDRVRGRWNKIPFVGTVGNDTVISEAQGPRVSVHLDLPIRYKDQTLSILFVPPDQLELLR